jgi:hypothetical protein
LKNKTASNQTNLEKKMRQFQDVLATWKQLLNARMEENILLKYKISEILKNNFNQNFLEKIEEFQTQFIREDEWINLLRKEVSELENYILSKKFQNGTEQFFDTRIENLRKDVADSGSRFRVSKSAFENFQNKISGNLEKKKF